LKNANPAKDSSTSPIAPEPWQTFIHTLTGKIITIATEPNDTVDKLWHLPGVKEGGGYAFFAYQCRLLYAGKQLEANRMLSDYGIQKNSTLHLVLRMLGGLGGRLYRVPTYST
jgi:hypothetical protein